jgi:hypothetical protein
MTRRPSNTRRSTRPPLLPFWRETDAEHDRLRTEQKALGRFRPWMTHSVLEGAPTLLFHKQMLHDYVTVDAYCWTLIEEFGR